MLVIFFCKRSNMTPLKICTFQKQFMLNTQLCQWIILPSYCRHIFRSHKKWPVLIQDLIHKMLVLLKHTVLLKLSTPVYGNDI